MRSSVTRSRKRCGFGWIMIREPICAGIVLPLQQTHPAVNKRDQILVGGCLGQGRHDFVERSGSAAAGPRAWIAISISKLSIIAKRKTSRLFAAATGRISYRIDHRRNFILQAVNAQIR